MYVCSVRVRTLAVSGPQFAERQIWALDELAFAESRNKALGKVHLCHVLSLTLGKDGSLPSVNHMHSAKAVFTESILQTLGKC
jgi:hypothetical protein